MCLYGVIVSCSLEPFGFLLWHWRCLNLLQKTYFFCCWICCSYLHWWNPSPYSCKAMSLLQNVKLLLCQCKENFRTLSIQWRRCPPLNCTGTDDPEKASVFITRYLLLKIVQIFHPYVNLFISTLNRYNQVYTCLRGTNKFAVWQDWWCIFLLGFLKLALSSFAHRIFQLQVHYLRTGLLLMSFPFIKRVINT